VHSSNEESRRRGIHAEIGGFSPGSVEVAVAQSAIGIRDIVNGRLRLQNAILAAHVFRLLNDTVCHGTRAYMRSIILQQ